MKKLGIALVMLLLSQQIYAQLATKQPVFMLDGEIEGINGEWAYIVRFRDARQVVTDSALVRDGKFQIKGVCTDPELVFMKFNKRVGKYFFLEAGKIKVTGTSGNIRNMRVEESKSDQVYESILAFQQEQRKEDDLETARFKEVYAVDKVKAEVMRDALQVMRARQNKDMAAFLKSHAKNGAAQFFYLQYFLNTQSVPAIEVFLNATRPVNNIHTRGISEKLLFLKGLQPGALAPVFSLPDVNGKTVSVKDYLGRYVLIDFWASWCSPCRMENPNVVKAYQRYKDKGFTVLGVSLDDKKEKWLEAIAKDGLTWTHVSDLGGWKSPPVAQYNVSGVPFSVLVDPAGKIIGTNLKGVELQQTLEKIFQKTK
jgi:thiol-disulfide isomerase/thioredoxin